MKLNSRVIRVVAGILERTIRLIIHQLIVASNRLIVLPILFHKIYKKAVIFWIHQVMRKKVLRNTLKPQWKTPKVNWNHPVSGEKVPVKTTSMVPRTTSITTPVLNQTFEIQSFQNLPIMTSWILNKIQIDQWTLNSSL